MSGSFLFSLLPELHELCYVPLMCTSKFGESYLVELFNDA